MSKQRVIDQMTNLWLKHWLSPDDETNVTANKIICISTDARVKSLWHMRSRIVFADLLFVLAVENDFKMNRRDSDINGLMMISGPFRLRWNTANVALWTLNGMVNSTACWHMETNKYLIYMNLQHLSWHTRTNHHFNFCVSALTFMGVRAAVKAGCRCLCVCLHYGLRGKLK